MAHYSEMDFLFNTKVGNKTEVTKILDIVNDHNVKNVFNSAKYVVYKDRNKHVGTENLIKYYKEKIETTSQNPYTKLLNDFSNRTGTEGAGLRLRAADFAYLRDLGVYPINRMAILRRFPEGCFIPEDLNEMKIEPISTVIGWIKADQNFGKVDFNESWTKTTDRFDVLLTKIVKKAIGLEKAGPFIPIPDFAQGALFEFYKKLDLTQRNEADETSVDDNYEYYNSGGQLSSESASPWGLNKIPVGDPNVLQEGPFRNPVGQNIQSDFTFELETTYEQKILGEVDPGSAMLDILDNLYAMGTSDMKFYWGDGSSTIRNAMEAASGNGNNFSAWLDFITEIVTKIWKTITDLFSNLYEDTLNLFHQLTPRSTEEVQTEIAKKNEELASNTQKLAVAGSNAEKEKLTDLINKNKKEIQRLENEGKAAIEAANETADKKSALEINVPDGIEKILQSLLTSTLAIYRFELRGSIELMVGGKYSSTPWYLTLGNPYTPWLATNHIIITSASVETSNELGFNDQPQRLTAKFTCKFSRALGKQELMRMFNNSLRRTYSSPSKLLFDEQYDLVTFQNKKIEPIKNINVVGPIDTKTLAIRRNTNTDITG